MKEEQKNSSENDVENISIVGYLSKIFSALFSVLLFTFYSCLHIFFAKESAADSGYLDKSIKYVRTHFMKRVFLLDDNPKSMFMRFVNWMNTSIVNSFDFGSTILLLYFQGLNSFMKSFQYGDWHSGEWFLFFFGPILFFTLTLLIGPYAYVSVFLLCLYHIQKALPSFFGFNILTIITVLLFLFALNILAICIGTFVLANLNSLFLTLLYAILLVSPWFFTASRNTYFEIIGRKYKYVCSILILYIMLFSCFNLGYILPFFIIIPCIFLLISILFNLI